MKLLLPLIGILVFGCAYFSDDANAKSGDLLKLTKLENNIVEEKYKKISSVLVQKNGQLVYEKYFNGGSAEHLNDIRSAGKSITSLLFGQAIERGLFQSENDKVLPIFADKKPIQNPFPAKSSMTFSDLLMMSSKLECNDMEHFSAGNEERMYLRKDWEQFVLDLPEGGAPPWATPSDELIDGRRFSYCTGGVFLIGSAIARRSKISLDKFAQKYLFTPLGINKVTWPRSPMGIVQGGGGIRLQSIDMIKIGQLLLDKGRLGAKQVVKSEWIDKMFTLRVNAMPERNIDYGYLWWIFNFKVNNESITAYAATGNGGNYLLIVPEKNLVAVITATAYNTQYMHSQTQEIFEKHILKAILEY